MSEVKARFKPTYEIEDGILTVDYVVGEETQARQVFDINDFYESQVYNQWLLQALFTTLSARASQYKGLEKMDYMQLTYDTWLAGEWSPERKGGVRTIRIEVEALAQVKACPIPTAGKAWKALSPAQQEQLVKHPSMVAAIAEVAASRESEEALDLQDMLVS